MRRQRRRIEYPDELYHYGVKGMKWGVRRIKDRISQYRQARRERKYKNRYDFKYRENRWELERNDSKYNDLDWKFRNQYDLESERAMRRGLYLGDDVPYSKKLKSLEKSLDDRGKFLDKKAHEMTKKQMDSQLSEKPQVRPIKSPAKNKRSSYISNERLKKLDPVNYKEYRRALDSGDLEVRALVRQELKKKGLY